MGFHDSLVPLAGFGCEQVKFRPKKKVKIKVSQSVVAVGTVWGRGRGAKAVKHDMYLISEPKFLLFD